MRNDRRMLRRFVMAAGLAVGVGATAATAQSNWGETGNTRANTRSNTAANTQQNTGWGTTSRPQADYRREQVRDDDRGWFDWNRDNDRQVRRNTDRNWGWGGDEDDRTYYHLPPYDRPGYLGIYEEDVMWDEPVENAGDAASSPDWRYGYYDPETRTGYPIYRWDDDSNSWVRHEDYDGWLERGEWPDQPRDDRRTVRRDTGTRRDLNREGYVGLYEDDPIWDDPAREGGDAVTGSDWRYGYYDPSEREGYPIGNRQERDRDTSWFNRDTDRRQRPYLGVYEDDPVWDDPRREGGDAFTGNDWRYGYYDPETRTGEALYEWDPERRTWVPAEGRYDTDTRQQRRWQSGDQWTGRNRMQDRVEYYDIDVYRMTPQERQQYQRNQQMRNQQSGNQQMRYEQQMRDQQRYQQQRMEDQRWQQQNQRSRQQSWFTGEDDRRFGQSAMGRTGQLNGRILAVHSVELDDAEGTGNIVFITTQDGSGHLVDLGDKTKDDLKIQRGSQIQVRGQLNPNTGVLKPQQLRVDGQDIQVPPQGQQQIQQMQNRQQRDQQMQGRQQQQRDRQMQTQQPGQSGQRATVSGQVSSAERATVSGAEGTVIRIQLQSGQSHLVDIGTGLSLEDLKLQEGDQRVQINGTREIKGGQTIIKASSIRVGDQTHQVNRQQQR